ncbi:MAG: NO-inducible flavohemoprotein [Thiohalospira sp.]
MALSPEQIETVQATVPLLREHGEALTTRFYQRMFTDYPEVKTFFNQAHQADGRQPRALADAVLAWAENLHQPAVLQDAVERIVHKHVSLNIQPEHYPIVGNSLLAAMQEVGGNAVTPEVVEAWGAAYWELANLLIAEEEKVYADHANQPGGWRGKRAFRVKEKRPESAVITSFVLEPVDGGPVMDFTPGQYIGLQLEIDGETTQRNYSLSDAPNGRTYRISVKREPGGHASRFLHDRVAEGDTLHLFPPAGDFVLQDNDRPINLVTGGVGITPAMAMTEAVAGHRPVRFIHAALTRDHHAFRERVEALAAANDVAPFFIYEEGQPGDGAHATGRLDRDRLAEQIDLDGDVYFLGPTPFMRAVKGALDDLGIPAERQHYEFFGPAEALA